MIKKLKFHRDYHLIKRSGLFDANYYLLNNPDVRRGDVDPLKHFLKYGWIERRNPSPFFDTNYYLVNNPDVEKEKCNPLVHYLRFGGFEGREPSAMFSSSWYMATYDDVREAKINPLVHYMKIGVRENRLPKDPTINTVVQEPSGISKHLITIIIPVFNALAYTKTCLENVYKYQGTYDFEVIIVNNGSTDGTKEWLEQSKKQFTNLNVYNLEKNKGFGPAVNIGIQKSISDYVMILNNDTIPSPNWIEGLILAFEKDSSLGIVSPVTNYVGEGLQVNSDSRNISPDDIEEFANKIANRNEIIYEPNRLVFFCAMIRRTVIDLIGLLDESYIRGNFEDDDYCLRARYAGYRLGIAQNSFVYHHGSKTFKENKFNYIENFENNRKKFYLKAGRLSSFTPMSKDVRKEHREPDISVIVRTVNRPNPLLSALNSLVNQSLQSFEVILVNDGGPEIESIINLYEQRLTINYIHNRTSKGRTAALNVGLSASKGEWISYLDDDDIYYPWHLESMISASKASDSSFFYGMFNKVLLDPNLNYAPIEIIGVPCFNYSRRSLLIGNAIPINCWFHKKAIVDELGGFDEGFDILEDYEFILKVGEKYPFELVKKVICEYRFYLSQANSMAQLREDTLNALKRIYQRFPPVDEDMTLQREKILACHVDQVIKVKELEKQLDSASEKEKKRIYRQILNVIGAM